VKTFAKNRRKSLFDGLSCGEQRNLGYLLRTELQGTAGRVLQAAGVTVPPTVQQLP